MDVVDVALGRVDDPPLAVRQRPALELVLGPPRARAGVEEGLLQDGEDGVVVGLELVDDLLQAQGPRVGGVAVAQGGAGRLHGGADLAQQNLVDTGGLDRGHGGLLYVEGEVRRSLGGGPR